MKVWLIRVRLSDLPGEGLLSLCNYGQRFKSPGTHYSVKSWMPISTPSLTTSVFHYVYTLPINKKHHIYHHFSSLKTTSNHYTNLSQSSHIINFFIFHLLFPSWNNASSSS
ncbi:hypothetical protein L6452_15805 [Arctium lappa]|uniref:Uncharacterized protein n=1 Tax=Arctium lappa TaxID=4217 RepID=A0ACB9CPX0_ARCLA|nr:hypothetical protein L6452_15805 [Arctium lappa]